MASLETQIAGYRLTTAEILYHLPDAHELLQTFVWQDYDMAPEFPVLKRFLDFWETNIEGPLHSVRVAHAPIISPSECRAHAVELRIH